MTRKKPQLSIPTCVSVAAIVSAPSAQSLITQSVRINDSAQRVPTGLIAEMNKIDQHMSQQPVMNTFISSLTGEAV